MTQFSRKEHGVRPWVLTLLLIVVGLVLPRLVWAETGLLRGARTPLVALTADRATPARPLYGPRQDASQTGPSLFAGASGVLAPMPARLSAPLMPRKHATGPVAGILDIIARAEAGPSGYDAVQYGARTKPPRPPTRMTLAEIEAWTRDTPGQPHAIGRYQFIPATLRRLTRALELPADTRFTPDIQDRLAERLLMEAGLDRFRAGELGRIAFMNNLARIWAGLPTSSGRSHYHGYAGNKATMSWARFEREMAGLFGGT